MLNLLLHSSGIRRHGKRADIKTDLNVERIKRGTVYDFKRARECLGWRRRKKKVGTSTNSHDTSTSNKAVQRRGKSRAMLRSTKTRNSGFPTSALPQLGIPTTNVRKMPSRQISLLHGGRGKFVMLYDGYLIGLWMREVLPDWLMTEGLHRPIRCHFPYE